MNRVDCHVIYDLLPLYIDKACSRQTVELVEAHLQSCESCKAKYEEMSQNLCAELTVPDFEGKELFRSIRKNIFGVTLAAAAMISCFAINANAAWMGGPAGMGNLAATIIYLVFWGVFSVISRKYKLLLNLSFVVSLFTCISAINGLVWHLLDGGGFLSAFITIFTSIPFYGLRYFMDWTEVYVTAGAVAIGWLVYTGRCGKKLEKILGR